MARPAKNKRTVKWSDKYQAWKADVIFPDGSTRRVQMIGKDSYAKAQERLEALLLQRQLMDAPPPEAVSPTYSDVIDAWIEAGCPNGGLPNNRGVQARRDTIKSDNTTDQAETLLRNHVKEFGAPNRGRLGDARVNKSNRKELKEHFIAVDARRRQNAKKTASYEEARIASSTVYRIWWHLANAVEWAKNEEDMGVLHNPVLDTKLPPVREGRQRRAFMREELPAIFATILKDARRALWLTFLIIGARPGEVIGLRWPNLDLDGELPGLWIEEQAEHRGSRYVGQKDPKHKSFRAFVLHPLLADALRQQRQGLIDVGLYDPEGFVFPTATGDSLGYSSIRRWLDKLMEQVNLGNWTPYELRHSFVSLTYDEVQDLRVVADLAGHEDVKTTLGYRHKVRELDPRGAVAWDGLIRSMKAQGLDPDPHADLAPVAAVPEPELPPVPPLRLVVPEPEPGVPQEAVEIPVAEDTTVPFGDAIKAMGISEYRALKMVDRGVFPLPVRRKGRAFRVPLSDLMDHLKKAQETASPQRRQA